MLSQSLQKSRKILISLIIIIGCLILGIGFLLGTGVVIGRGENQSDIRSELGLWTPGTTIEQSFVASQNNLGRLDFAVDSYYPWDSPYLDCRLFEITTSEDPHDLSYEFMRANMHEVRYKRINGWMISGHMFNSFSFAPIADSQDKRYLLSIQSPGLKKGGTSILLASARERYEWGDLFVNGKKKNHDLAFRALYRRPRSQLLRESVARLALQKPFPFSMPAAYYVVFGVYLALIMMFVFLIIRP